MKWRVMMEVTGADGAVRAHEIGGGAAVDEYSPRSIGLTLAEGKLLLAGLQQHLVHALSGDRVNPSTGDTKNPATLRSRERQVDGSIGHISAWQGWAETGDEDAGRGSGDAAASRFGLGDTPDRGWVRQAERDQGLRGGPTTEDSM